MRMAVVDDSREDACRLEHDLSDESFEKLKAHIAAGSARVQNPAD